ncbi:MAG: aminodeoxychorismate lyase [Gammaproteobacteria bacterium]|nr:MAG: aminodeoxychorismate lyase [Gammaproteobacteria bacterium]
MITTLINGESKATININDRGLQYGDGLFETMAVHNSKVHLWEAHWQRLSLGCKKLSITLPDKEVVEKEIDLLCNESNKSLFVIKLIVTRGEGLRGYGFTNKQNVTRILSRHSWPDYPDRYQTEGVAVRYCKTTISENSKLAGIKHLNRLEQVIARNEWDTDEFQEGLMLTMQGNVVDGTMSNIFAVKDNQLFTPNLSLSGVAGVMRKTIIDIAKKCGLSVLEKDFTKSELELADELFLSNSLFRIWPVRAIAKTRFTKVGNITKLLQEEVNKLGNQ